MQHAIDPTQHPPYGHEMAQAISACVHCGFCLAACPTYQVLGEEMDSPRGRIVLMKSALEGSLTAEEAAPYLDRCLGCRACEPACPSGVAYGELLLGYRALTTPHRDRSRPEAIMRRLIIETLPYPNRFRLAVRAGRLSKLAVGLLPAAMSGMLRLLPERLPPAHPLPAVYPAQGARRARVALLIGCVQSVLAPDINWATLRVLAANGVETVVPAGQGCCGALLLHMGERACALALARVNLRAFPADVDAVVVNAAGCGSGMQEYRLLFKGEADADAASALAGRTQDVTLFLHHLGLKPPAGLPRPLRAVYQDACHLRHAQGVAQPPRALLRAIPNLTLLELADGGGCCGSAGVYNLEQPEIADELGRRKAQAIVDSGAQAVVSGNIGCLTQMQTQLRLAGAPRPLYHTLQLLDTAYHSAQPM